MQPLKPRTIVTANTDINSPRRTQRGEAATEFRIISRKDAKAAKKNTKYLSELSVLDALAGGISESEMFRMLENSPKPHNFSSMVVRTPRSFGICYISISSFVLFASSVVKRYFASFARFKFLRIRSGQALRSISLLLQRPVNFFGRQW